METAFTSLPLIIVRILVLACLSIIIDACLIKAYLYQSGNNHTKAGEYRDKVYITLM
ncbi:hypothetical protein Desgi_0284 [Desulfoscipio gibsoniae DSM 7213]|uniref:Uncharacterized protein n=1 Tax=Desulfoscipio gibsoniae DSM 7213 TaxID=767817 RepID=R4KH54_9FIRM|nr:hypothetical protein Desgi_0284 [Desulfoscipio gibsoniae DSM 7213]